MELIIEANLIIRRSDKYEIGNELTFARGTARCVWFIRLGLCIRRCLILYIILLYISYWVFYAVIWGRSTFCVKILFKEITAGHLDNFGPFSCNICITTTEQTHTRAHCVKKEIILVLRREREQDKKKK